MRFEPSSFLFLFALALLATVVEAAPSGTKSWQQTSYYNDDKNDPLKEPTSITVINHENTPNGCVTEICDTALSPVTINGACKVKQTKKCRMEMSNVPCEEESSGGKQSGCDSWDCSSHSSSSADSSHGSSNGYTSSSKDSSSMSTTTYYHSSSTMSADASSMTQSSDMSGSSNSSGYTSSGSSNGYTSSSEDSGSMPITTIYFSSTMSADASSVTQMSSNISGSSISSGSMSISSNTSASATSANATSTSAPGTVTPAASVNGLSTVNTIATPTTSGSASATGSSSAIAASSNASSSDGSSPSAAASLAAASAASAAAANSTSQAAFTLPGKKLSVLPIGLGVFAGISVIALIVVGLVTYERTKYRKAFRQRKLAESGSAMGYGGMAERT